MTEKRISDGGGVVGLVAGRLGLGLADGVVAVGLADRLAVGSSVGHVAVGVGLGLWRQSDRFAPVEFPYLSLQRTTLFEQSFDFPLQYAFRPFGQPCHEPLEHGASRWPLINQDTIPLMRQHDNSTAACRQAAGDNEHHLSRN